MPQLGVMQAQALQVDHVHIGFFAHGQPAAIVEAEEVRDLAGQAFHDELQPQFRTAGAVADPVREHVRRHAGVADLPAMRPAIAEAQDRRRIGEHLPHHAVIAEHVVDNRVVQHPFACAAGQIVVTEFFRRQIGLGGHRGDGAALIRLIIRGVAEDILAVEPVGDRALQRRHDRQQVFGRLLRQDLRSGGWIAQAGKTFGGRHVLHRGEGRVGGEGRQGCGQAEDDPHRPSRYLRGDVRTLGPRLAHARHQATPAVGIVGSVGQQEPERAAGFLAEPGDPLELPSFIVEVADHAEGAGAGTPKRGGDAKQFALFGVTAGDELAFGGLVLFGAGGREAEGAGAQGLFGQARHRGDVVRCGGLAADGAVAHDVDPQRVVRYLRGDVDGARHAGQSVEVIREGFPVPLQAFGEGDAGNVLHALHQVDQAVMVLGTDGGEADAAIAHEDRGRALPR